jgi:hypothetical protein
MRNRRLVVLAVAALAALGTARRAPAEPPGRDLLGLLNGAEEVDAAGNPDQGDLDAAGYAVASVDGKGRQVCVTEFKAGGVDGSIALFHIHKARAGQNGPVVVDFTSLLPSGVGCVPVNDRRLLSEIKRSSDKFYFNVHSMPNFPAGAIRGQVRRLAQRP